jgi:hypothetical protein
VHRHSCKSSIIVTGASQEKLTNSGTLPTCSWVRPRHATYTFSPHHFLHTTWVGQNRIYTPNMAVYLVVSMPNIPYVHRIYVWFWATLHMTYRLCYFTSTSSWCYYFGFLFCKGQCTSFMCVSFNCAPFVAVRNKQCACVLDGMMACKILSLPNNTY